MIYIDTEKLDGKFPDKEMFDNYKVVVDKIKKEKKTVANS